MRTLGSRYQYIIAETQMKTDPNSGSRNQQGTEVETGMQFLPDSPEHIQESMERLGPLRDKLYGAFQDAIGRARRGRIKSGQAPLRSTEADPKDDDLPR